MTQQAALSFPKAQGCLTRKRSAGSDWESPVRPCREDLVRHQVKNDVNAEGIGALLRKFMEKAIILAFTLPAIAVVAVVRRDDHDPALVVENGPDVHLPALLAVMVFPSDTKCSTVWVQAPYPLTYIRGLQLALGHFDVEHAVEELVGHTQFDELAFGQNPFDLTMKIGPLPLSPEIVGHEHAAVEQILPKD